jgi:DNA-binding XRE family transcriptional regulator
LIFADFLKVPLTTYSQWERDISNPTLEKALEIAKKLNKPVEEIWHYE